MNFKVAIGLASILVALVCLYSVQIEVNERTEPSVLGTTSTESVAKPDIGFLPADEIPATFNALSSGTAYGIAVPGRMVTPQATYKMLNPELQDSLTAMIDTTPKFRKGGFRYEELSDDEKNKLQDRSLKPGGNESKSLVSSISAGGQLTNSANNGGFIFIPADPHGAAGPNQVVNVFNTSIEFYDKDGSNGSSRSLESFFAPVSPLNFTFDPKVLYDQYEDRFVVVTLERQDTAGGDPDNTSRVLVAVSATSDPNGAWFMTAFNSEVFINGADRWFDYPGFAVDEEVIYLTGNMFGYGNAGTFGGVRMWMIDKTTFYAGGGATVIGPLDPFAGGGFEVTSQPAHTYGNPPAGMGTYLMGYSRLSNGTDEFWQFVRVDNPTGAVSFTQGFIFVGDLEPPTAGALPSAPQSGTGLTVQTNDPRALDAVWRDGQLFTSATIESGSQVGETSASWYVFDANGGGVVTNDFGIIDGEDISAGTFTFFPSIAVNADGGIGVGFSASSPSIFPGSYFAMRSPGDAAGTMRGSQVIRPGTDFYHRTFGGTNRWGDYSAVAVDPNDECFWVYNKHAVARSSGAASENGLYETAFGEFCNLAPVVGAETIAVNDSQTVTTLVGGATSVLANDSDADADDTISAVLTSGPTEASAFNLNANGTFSYTHGGGNNATDSFTYNACDDGSPQECTGAQVNISITLSDTPPTAVDDDFTVNEDSGTATLDVTDNDSNTDGGPLNVTAVGSASNGTAVQNGNNVNYTPNDDYCGGDAFTYTLNGGSSATVNMTVDCVNDDPVAVNDAASTNEDVLVAVSVLNGDSDVDVGDTLSVTSCSNASNGSVSRNGNNCEFTPALNFNGQGTFDYAISDGQGGTASASVTVTVNPVNDDPVAADDTANTDEDTSVSVDVVTGDIDVDGDILQATSCFNASNGSVVLDGIFCTFTPAADFNGQATFEYTIIDNEGGSDSASVTVTVNPIDDDPVAVNDAFTINEDSGLNVLLVTSNDTDIDAGPLNITAVGSASNGTAVQNGNNVDYTPNDDFCGSDSFVYDLNGGTQASVDVTVSCVNDEPAMVVESAVYVAQSEVGNPPTQTVACQFDFGPDNEDTSQSVADMLVNIQSDPNGILSSIDIDNNGQVSYVFSGNAGAAEVTVALQDDGGVTSSGDDTSPTYGFTVNVQDYIFRSDFEQLVCQ